MSKNTFQSAKAAALSALSAAATLDIELVAAVEKATSPKHTAALRELCNKRLTQHGHVAAAVRYLDQCASRPAADPVRAAILRGDVEVVSPAFVAEVFEPCGADDVDPEQLRLAEAVWPAWCKRRGVEVKAGSAPIGLLGSDFNKNQRLRPEWLPTVAHLWGPIIAELRQEIESDRQRLSKLRTLAASQLPQGRAGEVRDERGRTFWYQPNEIEAEISTVERFVQAAERRAAEVSKA